MAAKQQFRRVQEEVPIDPHSPFWKYREPVDPEGDPLELMLRCEQDDEVAMVLMGEIVVG